MSRKRSARAIEVSAREVIRAVIEMSDHFEYSSGVSARARTRDFLRNGTVSSANSMRSVNECLDSLKSCCSVEASKLRIAPTYRYICGVFVSASDGVADRSRQWQTDSRRTPASYARSSQSRDTRIYRRISYSEATTNIGRQRNTENSQLTQRVQRRNTELTMNIRNIIRWRKKRAGRKQKVEGFRKKRYKNISWHSNGQRDRRNVIRTPRTPCKT